MADFLGKNKTFLRFKQQNNEGSYGTMEWKLECDSSMQACSFLFQPSSFHSEKLSELTYLSLTRKIAPPSCERSLDVK